MWVYGDHQRRQTADEAIERVLLRLQQASALEGFDRHSALVSALIAAGELAQSVADADFDAVGEDRTTAPAEAAMLACRRIAGSVAGSWRHGFNVQAPADLTSVLKPCGGSTTLTLRTAEGYAFYGLYPEAVFEAASTLEAARWMVIGLRSIGTGLAAMAGAALASAEIVTVRPIGDPHARRLSLSAEMLSRLRAGRRWAVVDEGPGLSGSSFGAAIDAVRQVGGNEDAVWVIPSHAGEPGAAATAAQSDRWRRLRRAPARTEAVLLGRRGLCAWVCDLVGEPLAPLEDLSGGLWRGADATVPVFAQQERRKFLLRTEKGVFRLKFAGLGEIGERKLDRALRLADAGFAPMPLGLRHGFMVEHSLDGRRLSEGRPPGGLEWLGAYLGYRAAALPVGEVGGASPAMLQQMTRRNLGLALGEAEAERLCRTQFHPSFERGGGGAVVIDGRLQAWEWLMTSRGLLKTDAVDHGEAHDLIGCQPLEWDIAGASVEFELDGEQGSILAEVTGEHARRLVRPQLMPGYRLAYLAFQIGLWTYAGQSGEGHDQALAGARVHGLIAQARRLL
jgi:hypothetical protein